MRELRELHLQDEKLAGSKNEDGIESEIYNQVLKNIPEIFSISFSKEADLLSQWYIYARESGVRLGMLFPQETQEFQIKRKGADKEPRTAGSVLKDVRYFTKIGMTPQEYRDEKEVITQMIADYAKEKGIGNELDENRTLIWKDIAPYIKNYEFRQEKEVRLIFNANIGEKDDTLLFQSRYYHKEIKYTLCVFVRIAGSIFTILVLGQRKNVRGREK